MRLQSAFREAILSVFSVGRKPASNLFQRYARFQAKGQDLLLARCCRLQCPLEIIGKPGLQLKDSLGI